MRVYTIAIILLLSINSYGQKGPTNRVSMNCHPCTFDGFANRIEKECDCKINCAAQTTYQFLLDFSVKRETVKRTIDIAFQGHPIIVDSFKYGSQWMYSIYILPDSPSVDKDHPGPGDLVKLLTPAVIKHVTNGIEPQSAQATPGSFYPIEKKVLERVLSPYIYDHFVNNGSGLLPGPGAGNPMGIAIHGIHSLHSLPSSLIIGDNFPLAGSLYGLNPYDYDEVMMLKDASSSGLWGGFSSNNALVFTSAQGEYNHRMTITLNMNTTIVQRPNLLYGPRLGTDSFISAQRQFFDSHYYDDLGPSHPYTAAVSIFQQENAGTLKTDAANQLLAALNRNNLQSDIGRYLYRPSVIQQYHLAIMGGGRNNKYRVGLGFDNDPTSFVGNRDRRAILHGNLTLRSPTGRVETSFLFDFAAIDRSLNNNGTIPVSTPYDRLVDAAGKPMALPWQYNDIYMDTVGGGGHYPDTRYRPLQELSLANNQYSHRNVYGQVNFSWNALRGLTASGFFRIYRDWSTEADFFNRETYYVRDNIIRNGKPPGDMRKTFDTSGHNYDFRGQLRYVSPDKKPLLLTSLLGAELSDHNSESRMRDEQGIGDLANYTFSDTPRRHLVNRYASAFSSVSLQWEKRYSVYGSFRLDGANWVGIEPNRKWVAFWSVGYAQQLLKLDTAKGKYPDLLKARISYGRNGNPSNRNANLATQQQANSILYGVPQTGIANAPDPGLTYEKSYVGNLGIDFNFLRDSNAPRGRISGTIEYYTKRETDLLGRDSLSPATGWNNFMSNTAGITGYGFDFVLNTVNIARPFQWTTTVLLSIVKDKISSYPNQPSSPLYYVQKGYYKVGSSPAALFSYLPAGLDPLNGDPQGYLKNGQISKDYVKLQNDSSSAMVYSGSWQPQLFGNILNTFSYKNLSVSVGLSFEAKFNIRRTTINYSAMADDRSAGTPEFNKRWQVQGDEKITNVPSLPAAPSPDRDSYYQYSTYSIIPGDLLRLKDVQMSYTVNPGKKGLIKQCILFGYIANLGLIWRANKYKIDPDAINNPYNTPTPRSFSLGTRLKF